MNRNWFVGVSTFVAFVALCGSQISSAADEPAPKAKAAKAEGAAKHQLPDYYADVVDNEQREKIYAIQAEYDPQIKSLTATLDALKAKRKAAYAAVLTPAQQEKVAKAEAEAKTKRKAKAEAEKKAEMAEKKSDAAPAETAAK
jgi:colicin import membrane protein